MRPTVPQAGFIVGNALGCALSALLVFSGMVWYPLVVVVITLLAPTAALFVLGLWFGGYGRIRVGVALTAGNGAVLLGFGLYMLALSLFPGDQSASGIAVAAGALLMVFGYSVFAGAVARPMFRAWTRST